MHAFTKAVDNKKNHLNPKSKTEKGHNQFPTWKWGIDFGLSFAAQMGANEDGKKWYQRFTWEYFSRTNGRVLAEGSSSRDDQQNAGLVEMQELSSSTGAFGDVEDEPESGDYRDDDGIEEVESVGTVVRTEGAELKRCLTIWELLGYGVASTVGAGIYVVTGQVAGEMAGPGIVLCFLLAAAAALLSALAYAEFAARVPVSGSAYTFAYVSLGEAAAWFIGSNLTLEYSISASAVARGFSSNVAQLLSIWDITVPAWLIGYEINSFFNVSPLSALLLLCCTATLCLGVSTSAKFNIAMTLLNVGVILFVVLLGVWSVNVANYTPFLPFGFSGVLLGTGTVFFSFVGFDAVSTLAAEVKNPSRDLPIGICGTLGIATLLYVSVALIVCGMVSYLHINIDSPLSAAFVSVGQSWAGALIAVSSVIALTATTLCSLLGQPRIFYQMAVDGLLWPVFARLDSRQVPIWGTIISGVFSAVIALFIDLANLAEMISVGTLMAFAVVCGGVIILRYRPSTALSPDQERERQRLIPPRFIPLLVATFFLTAILFVVAALNWPLWAIALASLPMIALFALLQYQQQVNLPTTFACPLVPLLPCCGIVGNIAIILSLPITSMYRVIIWSALCFVIYFTYGIHHSRLNAPAVEFVSN